MFRATPSARHLGSVLRQIADSGPLRSRDSSGVDRENLGHHLSSVDLPAPFSPTRPMRPSSAIDQLTPSRILRPP